MQRRLVVEGCILGFLRDLKSFGIVTRAVVLRHLRSMSEGLRAKLISSLLPLPCYFLLKSRYMGSRILRKVFISFRGDLWVLGTEVISSEHRGRCLGTSRCSRSRDPFEGWWND
ncbi:hypothetical protein GUJ93_ZPchr0009g1008 [Zizania palustris]|uniref:Uncharacterized protein n=1 Tax=Zizania palustris TaxID=103762 RepID=A0A8J5RLY1_ZIZPA|nr:hypothetical protein GUJ93_ZPchr0009g1008 [Zizania palustris]